MTLAPSRAPGQHAAERAGVAAVVLAAHGSRDPRSAQTMRQVAAALAARRQAPVLAAFLDFNTPSIPQALRAVCGGAQVPIVVPALLTQAYHGRVDLPEVLRAAGRPARVTAVLGPAAPGDRVHPGLLAGLERRLRSAQMSGSAVDDGFDGVVLIAAGTSHVPARSTVEAVARELGQKLDVPCRVGYASASAPTAGEAVIELRRAGARRIGVASYFLAAGRLHDAAVASARDAGVVGVAEPLGALSELVDVLMDRIAAV